MALVNSTLAQHSVTHRSIETTLGFMSFAANVVPGSRPIIRQLYNVRTTTSQSHHIRVPSELKKDLSWWQMFLPQWNRIQLPHHPPWQILRLWTDASAQKAMAGYFLRPGENRSGIHTLAQLFSTTVPQWHKSKHINIKEMYAVLHALRTYRTESSASRIKLHCDNEAVVVALSKIKLQRPGN